MLCTVAVADVNFVVLTNRTIIVFSHKFTYGLINFGHIRDIDCDAYFIKLINFTSNPFDIYCDWRDGKYGKYNLKTSSKTNKKYTQYIPRCLEVHRIAVNDYIIIHLDTDEGKMCFEIYINDINISNDDKHTKQRYKICEPFNIDPTLTYYPTICTSCHGNQYEIVSVL